MAANFQRIYSSHVDEVAYDPEAKELHVRWQKGRTSVWVDVDAETAQNVLSAPSIGQELHRSVRGKFLHRYADGQADQTTRDPEGGH